MPGIAGIISNRLNLENRAELDTMVRCLVHEAIHESGTFVSDEVGVAIGWVSHAGLFSNGMPVWNEERNICFVLTGEDYQDRAAIDRLRAEGHQFGAQNASYLVHLYEDLGLKALEQMNGWFSGLIVDLRKGQAFLFNDRYGVG